MCNTLLPNMQVSMQPAPRKMGSVFRLSHQIVKKDDDLAGSQCPYPPKQLSDTALAIAIWVSPDAPSLHSSTLELRDEENSGIRKRRRLVAIISWAPQPSAAIRSLFTATFHAHTLLVPDRPVRCTFIIGPSGLNQLQHHEQARSQPGCQGVYFRHVHSAARVQSGICAAISRHVGIHPQDPASSILY